MPVYILYVFERMSSQIFCPKLNWVRVYLVFTIEFKWALGSNTMNKASGGDGIPVELFQILKDDAVKVLHSICQQIWKIQQWPH